MRHRPLGRVVALAHGVLVDLLQLLAQVVKQAQRLGADLQHLLDGVLHGDHGGEVAAAADRAAQLAQVGVAAEPPGRQVLGQLAGALLGVGEQLAQGESAHRLGRLHGRAPRRRGRPHGSAGARGRPPGAAASLYTPAGAPPSSAAPAPGAFACASCWSRTSTPTGRPCRPSPPSPTTSVCAWATWSTTGSSRPSASAGPASGRRSPSAATTT